MLVAKRLRKYRRVQPKTNMPIPWYSYGILGVFITAFAICLVHSSARRVYFPANLMAQSYVILGFVLAALAFIAMVWKFVKVRQQYNLRTLFAFTTAIAVLCSIAHYVRIAPLLIFFAPPAMEWAKCRSALKAATPANDTSGMQPPAAFRELDNGTSQNLLSLFTAFLAVGSICRKCHEQDSKKASNTQA